MRVDISSELELWGGVECTVNRVRDSYFNQLERSGHTKRAADLERFAALGIRALRYPVLWELTTQSWSWADERLATLRDLGLRPIVGLTHHGSGPPTTSLVDTDFPTKLGEFAARVAERYPWVHDYTPINEPLTTARFSGLYGLWYPHGHDNQTFARCLLNQCTGIAIAMERIREVNPDARLVQNEDIGHVYSTPALAEQAAFENERRWVTFDLLCGRVDRRHPMWSKLVSWGVGERELERFVERPCTPDLFGIDHYLTSDRWLDEDLSKYPEWARSGNEAAVWADVDAARYAPVRFPVETRSVLREAWERYRRPVVVTEVQLASTRDEQMRWLYETWCAAQALRAEEVDVRAITIWSLLGAYDWNKLVTREGTFYEPGAFDARAPTPRATAIARLTRSLARNEHPDEPVLETKGWWARADREGLRGARRLLVTGGTGTLARAFARICNVRGLPYHLTNRDVLDITDEDAVERWLTDKNVWAVVNAAGYVRVDDAEEDEPACMECNAHGVAVLARACARRDMPLLTFSSDLVFDGAKTTPYVESDPARPKSAYGRSKAAAEREALAASSRALVVRTSAFFGPWDDANFLTRTIDALARDETVKASNDVVSPTYVVDLVNASLDLLLDHERGVWHLANRGVISWAALAQLAARIGAVTTGHIAGCTDEELGLRAPRPAYSALASERGWPMPSLEDALVRYFADRRAAR